MKGITLTLLVVLIISALSPFSILTMPVERSSDEPLLGTLDLCSSAAPAVSAGGAMPCISSGIFISVPLMQFTDVPQVAPLFAELILSTSNEQPPRS